MNPTIYYMITKITNIHFQISSFCQFFRVERLNYGGLAKIIGTVVSVVGALVVTFYTGPAIIASLLSSITPQLLLGQSSDGILGGVLMLIFSILAASLYVAQVHCYLHIHTYITTCICLLTYEHLQAFILKKYPEFLILMWSQSSITAVLSILASLILEHDLSSFTLQSTTRLLVILYAVCWEHLPYLHPFSLLKYSYSFFMDIV